MLKQILKYILYRILELLENFEYRNLLLDENDTSKKILESLSISNVTIWTDTGWEELSHIHKTQPYTVWTLRTDEGLVLNCADNHIIFDEHYNELYVKDSLNRNIITEFGIQTVRYLTKNSYKMSMYDTTVNSLNHRMYTNGILSHNTVTSSFFMMWFLCFNWDKNVFVVANKGETMVEVLDKVKMIYEYLPYFMKPGIITNNVKSMVFDNKCRIVGQATTTKPGLGFTIHLLYCDEFAHIPPNILEPFWENVYPTLSSSQIARVIVTSTANGINRFSNIYTDAVKKLNKFHPIRVDWWEVPGRDQAWKEAEISNLGSEAAFNQQYGNQFLSSDSLLFDIHTLKLWDKLKHQFEWREIEIFDDYEINYKGLVWHKNFDIDEIQPWENFIFSIDLADGIGKDFTVCSIFKLEPMSCAKIRKIRKYEDELDFFRLKQVGMFRANDVSLDKFADFLKVLSFQFFTPDNVCIVLEINDNRGNIVINKLQNNRNYEDRMLFHTLHSANAKAEQPGVKLNRQNKTFYTNQLRSLVKDNKLYISDEHTINECSAFGIDNKGRYTSQLGNDDIVMSLVNLVPFFKSLEFADRVEEIYDSMPVKYRTEIERVMSNIEAEESVDEIDYSILDGLM